MLIAGNDQYGGIKKIKIHYFRFIIMTNEYETDIGGFIFPTLFREESIVIP